MKSKENRIISEKDEIIMVVLCSNCEIEEEIKIVEKKVKKREKRK